MRGVLLILYEITTHRYNFVCLSLAQQFARVCGMMIVHGCSKWGMALSHSHLAQGNGIKLHNSSASNHARYSTEVECDHTPRPTKCLINSIYKHSTLAANRYAKVVAHKIMTQN